ncbi:MAG: ABC transporter ATP-binding protein [Candidatus Marinimicrobia bacterium]|nr:ABC transporter ATP-binding protein [Candidatus Neomarinimicrobiota bacterium]
MEASITLKNVSKHFKNRYILSNLNFGIEKGSTFVVLGKNSEGKSTFLKLLAGINKPDNGKIYINGMDFSENRKLVSTLGFLGDLPLYQNNLTVGDNLQKRAQILGIAPKVYEKNKKNLAERFHLFDFLTQKVEECSQGIKKRLSIVLSLINDPAILIWDEPLAHLDFNLRQIVLSYLLEVKGEKTVVVATNEFTELHTIADRWIVLHNRGVRFDGDLEKMTTQINMPFLGQLELKKDKIDEIEKLKHHPGISKFELIGNSLNLQCKNLSEFHEIISSVSTESIIRVSCNSLDLEKLLNQLLSDEGLA